MYDGINYQKFAKHLDLVSWDNYPCFDESESNIDCLAKANRNFRTALRTGKHLQVTLMCIPAGSEIGVEMHPNLDQFLRIEDGCGVAMMGKCKEVLNYRKKVNSNYAVIVPAGTWHNIINTGTSPLKLYSIYAPPQHPFGTVHRTKADAEKSEKDE